MEEMKRVRLRKGDVIRLARGAKGEFAEDCRITAYMNEGGSSVCYAAVYGGKSGRLKEFYPADVSFGSTENFIFLRRTKEKQLEPVGDGMAQRFAAMCGDFIDAYRMLEEAKRDSADNEILNNYIPPYHLLYGCPKEAESCASVYVWTPDDKKGEGFDKYLAKVRKHPGKLPVHKLYHIISTMITLTDCIKALHAAGLLHLDIKPSNFLVPYNSTFEINTANISLFDINTLYPIDSNFPRVAGTEGYRAPEVDKGKAENRSDIYSIGAMLFYAVIICDEIGDGLYRKEYYSRLDQLVNGSELIQASEFNSNVFFKSLLAEILKKCLAAKPQDRYGCCEELIEDLKQAQAILFPDVVNASLSDTHKRLAVVEEAQGQEINPGTIMQNLLYRDPLLDWVPEGVSGMNVLVVGAGTYAQKFIDICLQAGQVAGYKLRITAVSNRPDYDRKVYLQFRPAIDRFVNVNGSLDGSGEEIYADLNFMSVPGEEKVFLAQHTAANRAAVEDLMLEAAGTEAYQYVFVALGDDELNREVAAVFSDAAKALELSCAVHFVVEAKEHKRYRKGNPVYVNDPISAASIHPELERMAFHVHMTWNGSFNGDMRQVRRQFREKYNYASSLAFALSIRYKLMSAGIREEEPEKAAAAFARLLKDQESLARMVAFEHRRWVMEKLADGWAAPLDASDHMDYEGCVSRGSVKDKARKLHPCIVRSTAKMPLKEREYTENHRAKWDEQGENPGLDELDTMSIELHRCFRKHAKQFIRQQPLHSGDMLALQRLTVNQPAGVVAAYNRFALCLKNILDGSQGYSKQYGSYEGALLEAFRTASLEVQREAAMRLRQLRKALFPVIECNMYRDYKAYDEELVRKIPFILTYRTQPYVAMAFDDGRTCGGKNDAVFGNVAAATVINPGKITYLYYFDGSVQMDVLREKIRAVMNYLDKRSVHSRIYVTIAFAEGTGRKQEERLREGMEELRLNSRLNGWQVLPCGSEEEAQQVLLASLANKRVDLFDGTTQLFTSPLRNSRFIGQVLERFSYFEFNWKEKQFVNRKGCGYLQYIENDSYIRIEDMFALKNAVDNRYHLPEFAADYEVLWSIYSGGYQKGGNENRFGNSVMNWNRMCGALQAYAEEKDLFTELVLETGKRGERKAFVYFFPGYGYQAAAYLLEKLQEFDVVSKESSLCSYASDTCKLELFTEWPVEEPLEAIFSKAYLLADPKLLRAERMPGRDGIHVRIYYDSLDVDGLCLAPNDKYSYGVLEALSQARFISRLRKSQKNSQMVSFAYTSRRMKKMLTTAGEILEVYTYYEALKAGYFDDVACGYEFRWAYGDVKNELDCVLTKGFRSLIVECKGRKELDQNFYHRLGSVADQFGIGAKKVLIANTYGHNEVLDANNRMQQARGEQMDIITVSRPDDILNIGYTLRRIMEGRYQG